MTSYLIQSFISTLISDPAACRISNVDGKIGQVTAWETDLQPYLQRRASQPETRRLGRHSGLKRARQRPVRHEGQKDGEKHDQGSRYKTHGRLCVHPA